MNERIRKEGLTFLRKLDFFKEMILLIYPSVFFLGKNFYVNVTQNNAERHLKVKLNKFVCIKTLNGN